ncbi:alcohol dehydrogenase catalytic domain-containing protein [Streptomyces sp. NPDC003996]
MKASGVSAPGAKEVTLLDLPEPPPPGAGQALTAVEAAGVGPWSRLLNTGGRNVGLRPPAALGVAGVGRVRAIGPGVQGISVGDRVVAHEAPLPGGSGFWAEQVLVAAAHTAPSPTNWNPPRRPHSPSTASPHCRPSRRWTPAQINAS